MLTSRSSGPALSATEADIPADPGTDATLLPGVTVQGDFEEGYDQDWYRFEASAGTTYRFLVNASSYGSVYLFDADGNMLSSGYDGWLAHSFSEDLLVFVAAENGEGYGPFTYELTADEVSDTIPGSTLTDAALEIGETRSETIDYEGDQDWFRVDVEAGRTYRFTLQSVDAGLATLGTPILALYDQQGNEILSNWGDPWGRLPLNFSAVADGPVFVGVRAESYFDYDYNEYPPTGDYVLSAVDFPGDVPGSALTSETLVLGATVGGRLDFEGDDDWYRFEVAGGRTYVFDVLSVERSQTGQNGQWVRLLDSEGNELRSSSSDEAGLAQIGHYSGVGGTVFLSVSGWEAADYQMAVRELVGDVADTPDTGAVLAAGTAINGTTDYFHDSDWYRIQVVAGRTYRFDLQGIDTGAGTSSDPWLALHAADGRQLSSSDIGGDGRDARLGFTARSDGEVFVEASGDHSGTYRLSVIEVAGDQPDNADTPATLAAGGIAHGTIDWAGEAPDRDWYRLELTAGHTYRIDLEGRSSGAGSLFNPQLSLVDAAGNPVPASGDYVVGWNDSSIVRASADTAIFAAISGFGSSGDRADTGTYRLSVTEVDDPVGQDVEAAADLPAGAPMDGAIEFAEDHDWFRIDAEAGVTYFVTLANVRLDGPNGAFALSLRNASGETFSQSGYTEDGADVELGFTAKADGDLFVDVLGNGTGSYRLEVAPFIGEIPDNELTQASLAVGSPVAGTIDWAEGARDTDWYRVEVVAGRTYVATMEGAASGAGTLPAPFLNLATAGGDWRDSVQSDGTATLSFTAARDDTVFVVASGYGADEEGFYSPFVGSYRLSLREIPNDIADDIHTAATLSVGQVVDGTFDFAEDRDRYRVEVVAGKTYVFDIAGTASGEGNSDGTYLLLYDSDGNYLRETSSGQQPGLRLGWTADTDGAVYIETLGLVPGGYRLGLSELTGDVPGSVDGAATLEPGRATDGVVDYDGDEDLYRFDALAGHTYRVLLAGSDSAAGTLASPRLWLVDSEGGRRSGSPASDDSADRVLGITADADGPVVIGAGGADAGTYSLSVEDLTTDILASPATTQTLAVGAKIDGIIDIADDRDWYRIEVIAGRTYYVELTGLNQDTTAVETALLTVRDSDGNALAWADGFSEDHTRRVGFLAPVDGELYIEIADKRSWDYETNSERSTLGPYRVGLQELLEEAGGDPEKASSLVADTRLESSIQWRGDSDWYRIEAVAGESFTIDVAGIGSDALPSVEVSIYDSIRQQNLGFEYGVTPEHVLIGFTAPADGSYFVLVDGKEYYPYDSGWDYIFGSYEINVSRIVDTPDGAASTAFLKLGVARTDSIDYFGDVDCFHLAVTAGTTYAVRLEGASTEAGTLWGTWLEVEDLQTGDGFYGNGNGVGSNSELSFTATSDGEVLVFARGGWTSSGSYRLTASEVVGDVAGDDASVTRLGLQAPVDSAIEVAGDADVYRVAVEAGRTYLFELEGAATAGGTLANAGLSLRYAGGVDIRHDEGGGVGGNARLEFTPATDGEILVVATGAGDEGNTGSYRLSVTMEPPALSDDLPLFVDGEPLPAAAIQQETYSNGPEAGGEVFATWLGGSGQLDSAVGAFMPGWDSDPMIAFASTSALNSGDAVSLGWGAPGLFLLPGEAALGAELAALPAGSLALLDGNTGEPVTLDDGASPQLVRVDGQSPVVVTDDMLFAVGGHGRDIGAPVPNILNPGGFVQATVGSFWRDGIELCRVVAFEETAFAGGQSDGDFDDAILALSVGRLSDDDVAAIRDALLA